MTCLDSTWRTGYLLAEKKFKRFCKSSPRSAGLLQRPLRKPQASGPSQSPHESPCSAGVPTSQPWPGLELHSVAHILAVELECLATVRGEPNPAARVPRAGHASRASGLSRRATELLPNQRHILSSGVISCPHRGRCAADRMLMLVQTMAVRATPSGLGPTPCDFQSGRFSRPPP